MVPKESSVIKIVLERAGHALNSATQLVGDEEWALLPSAQQIDLAMETKTGKRQKEKRDKWKPECNRGHWWCHLSAQHLEPIYFPQWRCERPQSGPRVWRGRGWADGEPQHRDSWGERRACPWVGPVSLGSLNGLSRRSNSKVQIPEPGRGSGKLTGSKARPQKGQNNGNWISALRIEPGARTASESEPRWSSTFIVTNLLSSPSPFSQWRSKEKQGQGRGFGVRRFSLSPYSLIISHVMLNLFGLLWNENIHYSNLQYHCEAQIRSQRGDDKRQVLRGYYFLLELPLSWLSCLPGAWTGLRGWLSKWIMCPSAGLQCSADKWYNCFGILNPVHCNLSILFYLQW